MLLQAERLMSFITVGRGLALTFKDPYYQEGNLKKGLLGPVVQGRKEQVWRVMPQRAAFLMGRHSGITTAGPRKVER